MLADCYECGKKISTEARICPNCGYNYTCEVVDFPVDQHGDSEVRSVKMIAGGTVETESGNRRMSIGEFVETHNNAIQQMVQEYDRKNSSSGCFIATAAYGTPLAEEISLLRRFRDKRLARCRLGLAFITTYYRLSPPIAEIIEQSGVLRTITRIALRPVIWLLRK